MGGFLFKSTCKNIIKSVIIKIEFKKIHNLKIILKSMPIITWKDEYSVGVKELDEQHKKLMEMINELSRLYTEKKFKNADVDKVFNEFTEYATYHLDTEEHYFNLYGYPDKDKHVPFHDKYRAKTKELKEKYNAGKIEDVLFEINNFIYEWWTWHILNVDKEYTSFFNANGLK